ncbi:sigma-70 family RNA polymerase sigma factor [Microbacterium sp. HJ5]
MTDQDDTTTGGFTEPGDADLVLRTRSGDRGAFGELWRRHYRSGITVARNVSPGTDADDLVQEAYTRIYQSILKGGGPTGSFRAYLFTSIRNTAAGWGRARRETAIDELESLEDPATTEQATADSLDRSLTHQAFRSLPTRWQEVLWYSEIEGMKPAEIAPLLGMKPTAVAQLTFRAREGLREAWIQAHLRSVADGSDCAWSIERLGAYSRNNIGRRDRARLETHLAGCARCAIVASEAKEVSSRLALVLIPITVGIAGTAGYLASLQGGGAPVVALAAMPSSVFQGAVSGAGAAGTVGAGTTAAGSPALVGAGMSAGAGTAGAAGAGATAGAGSLGAAVAGTASAASAAGVAAVTTATVATSGVVSAGVAGLAAAGLVVAGTVAAVALPAPAETDLAERVSSSSAVRATDEPIPPLESMPEAAVALSAADGPSPSDIPTLPAEEPGAKSEGADPSPRAEQGGSNNGNENAGGSAAEQEPGAGNGGTAPVGNGGGDAAPVQGGNAGHGNAPGGTAGTGNTGNTGNVNAGTGNGNPGNANTGNTGNGNTGNTNTGNAGNANTGNANAGNTGNANAGNANPVGGGAGSGTPGNGAANGNGALGGSGNAGGNSGNGNTGNGNGNGNGNGGTGNGNGGTGNGGTGGGASEPAVIPSIVSSTSIAADGATTIEITLQGPAGATVQARIRGSVRASATIGVGGSATLIVHPSSQEVAADSRVEFRYVAGAQGGQVASHRISELL